MRKILLAIVFLSLLQILQLLFAKMFMQVLVKTQVVRNGVAPTFKTSEVFKISEVCYRFSSRICKSA
jgi:hypothetical protein